MKFSKYILLTTLLWIQISTDIAAQTSDSSLTKVEASFTYTGDFYVNAAGGLEQGYRYMDNIDVIVSAELNNFSFFFYGLGNQGKSISALTGDIQTLSNIEAENSWRLYEAWGEYTFSNLYSSLIVGLFDLNSEFDVIDTGQLFINSSHGIGADFGTSGPLGPSIFPYTSLSARLKINPFPWLSIKTLIADGIPSDPANTRGTHVLIREEDGALISGEIEIAPSQTERNVARGILPLETFRFAIGGWKYTKERVGWKNEKESDHGIYALFEGRILKENGNPEQGLSAFIRAGAANRDINRFNFFTGAGLAYTGLLKGRDSDLTGLAVSLPFNSDEFIESELARGNDFSDNELAVEFTYQANLTSHFSVQFDCQYILNPNVNPNTENALVFGLRSIISF